MLLFLISNSLLLFGIYKYYPDYVMDNIYYYGYYICYGYSYAEMSIVSIFRKLQDKMKITVQDETKEINHMCKCITNGEVVFEGNPLTIIQRLNNSMNVFDFMTCVFVEPSSKQKLIKIVKNISELEKSLNETPKETNFIFICVEANINGVSYPLKLSDTTYSYYVIGNIIDYDVLRFLFKDAYPSILTNNMINNAIFTILDHEANYFPVSQNNVIEFCDLDENNKGYNLIIKTT